MTHLKLIDPQNSEQQPAASISNLWRLNILRMPARCVYVSGIAVGSKPVRLAMSTKFPVRPRKQTFQALRVYECTP
jgi:hypothetical protein